MGKIANGYITIVDLNDGVKYDILVSTANAVVNDTTGVVTYSCSGYLKSIKGKFTSNISNATIYLYADDTKVALVNTTSAGLFTFTLGTVSKSTANSLILRYYENNDTTKGLLASYTIPVSHNYNKTYSYIRYSNDGGQTFTAADPAKVAALPPYPKCIIPQTSNYWEAGKYSQTDGSKVDDSAYMRTKELAAIEGDKTYVVKTNSAGTKNMMMCIYDASKVFLRYVELADNSMLTTLSGDAYIGCFGNVTVANFGKGINNINTFLPAIFEPYKADGRNLLLATNQRIANPNYLTMRYNMASPIIAGEKVTITLHGHCSTTNFDVYNSGGSLPFPNLKKQSENTYTMTNLWPIQSNSYVASNTYVNIYAIPKNNLESTIDDIKIEYGDTYTGYTPAQEDVLFGTTEGEYMGTLVWDKPYPSNNPSDYTWVKIVGNGVKSILEYYQVSSSNSSAPTTWQTSAPLMTATNKYLWNYETITYADNTTYNTAKRVIGVYGSTGKGIVSITNKYQVTSAQTGVTISTGTWKDTPDSLTPTNKYLWNYEIIKYTEGADTTTVPHIIGVYGDLGIQGLQGLQGPKGDLGILGPAGATLYTWIKYADSPSSGMSDSPTGKKYIGIAYNKNTVTKSTTYTDYTWSLILGPKGDTGVQGPKGTDGLQLYTWIKYATSSSGANMSDSPDGKTYIGLAYNKTTAAESNTASDYTWSLILGPLGPLGPQGATGLLGPKGDNGQTSYFHIKYAPVANPTAAQMNETGGDYIGTYVDFTAADSTDPTKYTWVLTKGAQGPKGAQGIAGKNGVDGKTSYLHIAYATNATGTTGFSVSESTGKTYIGQYTDFTADDSTDPTKYSWTLIKGETGKGIASVTEYYQVSSSATTAPTSWRPTPPATTSANRYLWNYEKITYTDGTSTDTQKRVVGVYGDTGLQGPKGDDAIVYGIDCSNQTPNVTNGDISVTLKGWRRVGNGNKTYLFTGYTYSVTPSEISSSNVGSAVVLIVPKGYTSAITLTVTKNDTNEVVANIAITPIVNGTHGIAGVPGCTQRVFKEYIATEQTSSGNSTPMVYHNDSDEDAAYSAIRFVDIMCIRNDDNTTGYDVYMCKRTHSAAATWAEDYTPLNWEEVSFNSVSAFFLNLIAKNATIEMLSSSCIAIMDKDNPGIRKTGMANPVDDNQPAIWAGATSNSDLTTAPFYVTNTGYLHSTSGYFRDVTITGYLGGVNGWEVTANEIKNRTSELPKITLYKDGTQFLVLGQPESMLSVRNDNGNGISILTQSASAAGLNITAQAGSRAIDSHGTVNMYSRSAEHTMINSLVLGAAQASKNVGMSSCSQNTSFDDTGFTGQPVAVLFTRSTTNEITVTLPSSPKIGQIAIVVQCTDKKVYINGNGKRFYHGSIYTAGMANSNANGQWNVFIYDGTGWQSVYMQGRPF